MSTPSGRSYATRGGAALSGREEEGTLFSGMGAGSRSDTPSEGVLSTSFDSLVVSGAGVDVLVDLPLFPLSRLTC